MSALSLFAIFFVTWWLCLFFVLPFGVRTQDDANETILGTHSSAPVRPMLVRKAIATTVLATIVTGGIWIAHDAFGVDLDSLSRAFG